MDSKKRKFGAPLAGLSKFLQMSLDDEVKTHKLQQLLSLEGVDATDPRRVLEIVDAFNFASGAPSKMVVRESHQKLARLVDAALGKGHVLVGGGRGLGKSMWAEFFAVHLATREAEARVVVLRRDDRNFLLV